MLAKVRYFGKFRSVTEKLEETINFSGRTVKDLLDKLCKIYGERFQKIVINDNKLPPDVIILVNGKSIGDNLRLVLKDGDTVSIMPFVSGG